jgi:glycosyltransferase involved in cell wall biosynthesis
LATVTVLHPWMPQYRVSFFVRLVDALRNDGISLQVLHGSPPPDVSARRDALDVPWARELPTQFIRVGGRDLAYHRLRNIARGSSLLILEQAIRNLETYPLLLRALLGGPNVAFWGHGRTYTKHHGTAEERVKQWLTKRGCWFFAYTQGGAQFVIDSGFPAQRVTVVQNSVDTDEIRRLVGALPLEALQRFRVQHGLTAGRTALYIGGLDADKRVAFLLEAADLIRREFPDFRLLVAGDGSDRHLVERPSGGTVIYLGRVFGVEKALLGRASSLMLMPGRVGLGVVDAFALGTPLFTTAWPYHAPEVEYLEHNVNGFIAEDNVEAFAAAVTEHLRHPERLRRLVDGCARSAETHTLDVMVENFRAGVVRALALRR